jgi:hypothetical protein
MKRRLLFILLCLGLFSLAAAEEKTLTRGEVVEQISAADFMKEKIGQLLSWTVGYDVSKVNRASLVPIINYVKAMPKKVPPDGRTILVLTASVDDPGGLQNIGGVRGDLSTIGKFPNMMLVDNGLWGDEVPDDGIYTLQTNVDKGVETGNKEIAVAAVNKKGWLAVSRATVDVQKDPVITEVTLIPDQVTSGRPILVNLQVKIDNPGRAEDLNQVVADLSAVGGGAGKTIPETAPGVYSLQFAAPAQLNPGSKKLIISAVNNAGGSASAIIQLEVNR